MGYRNEALYEAVKKYVTAATAFIVDKMKDDDPASDADGRNFFFARFSLGSELSTMQEYRHCLEVLLADPKIVGQLDLNIDVS